MFTPVPPRGWRFGGGSDRGWDLRGWDGGEIQTPAGTPVGGDPRGDGGATLHKIVNFTNENLEIG
jgi:hypothetical protein